MNKQSQRVHPADNQCNTSPPFAVNELLERCMGNAAVATLLLDKFEQQLAADVEAIQESLAAGDTGQLAQTAHALKGAAGALAAATLRDLAARIETLSRTNQRESIAHELTSLRSEVARCLAQLPAARAQIICRTSQGLSESGGP